MSTRHVTLYKNNSGEIGFWEAKITLEGELEVRYASKMSAKPVTQRIAKDSPEQLQKELDRRIRAKLDKGYVDDLEKAKQPKTNALDLPLPMLATPLKDRPLDSAMLEHAFLQPKLDGHRCLFNAERGVLYSRGGRIIELPHIRDAILDSPLASMNLDGELYVHGESLPTISSWIKRNQEHTTRVQYWVYDHICDKSAFRERLVRLLGGYSALESSVLKMTPTHVVQTRQEVWDLHDEYRNKGYEGSILRIHEQGYLTGKRSQNLIKLKEFHDAEFKVIGVHEGKPYITDLKTFQTPVWECDAGNGETFRVTAAGTCHEKHAQWEARDALIGKLLTVKYHYLSDKGIPQLPVALRWRDDV